MPRATVNLSPLFQLFTDNPAEHTDPSTGLPARPSLMQRLAWPDQAAAADAINLRYSSAPAFNTQENSFRDARFPVELGQDVTKQNTLGQAAVNLRIKNLPDLSRAESDAEIAAKKAADAVALQKATEHWTAIRATGKLPQQLADIPDEKLAMLYPQGADFGKMAQEAQASSGILGGAPDIAANAGIAQDQYRIPLFQNQATEQNATKLAYNQNPDVVNRIARNTMFGEDYFRAHGAPFGQLPTERNITTMDNGQVFTDPNRSFVSPTLADMQDKMTMASQMGGLGSPHEIVGAQVFPKIGAGAVPSGGRPVVGMTSGQQQVARPVRALPFGETFGGEKAITAPAMTKEEAIQSLGAFVDKAGQIQLQPQPARTAFGRSAIFGTEERTPEELLTIRKQIEKIISNPNIPWGTKK